MELGRLFGFLHPALVHFPLVLLLAAFALELTAFVRRDDALARTAQATLVIGAVATLFAFVCGNFAEIWAARDGVPQEPMEQHELYATITSWLFVFLAAGRAFLRSGQRRGWMAGYLAVMACACVLLVVTGHKGAMLVYHRSAGVQTGAQAPIPTHEDLAVLRQKQDPEALFYSNKMHHVFGCMVMIFSGLLLIDMFAPALGRRLRKVTPLLLLAGGVFLMIFSDTDSWPLSHQRPITDKEVVMHKTYATLMLVFGIQGLWPRRRRRVAETEEGAGRGADEAKGSGKQQGRMMAVFSLVGGALLFTHVHSNAPYANVAVGVYLHHTVMGLIALAIGAVKLAQDALAGRVQRRVLRLLAAAYPCLMLVESIFLLNYNEGLPWFLGYRSLSLAAPHGGLIAPLGRQRAELLFDPSSARIDVYLLEQAADRPFPIQASEIQAIVRQGTESTAVALTAAPEQRGFSHYFGFATFLRGAQMFQAQALVPLDAPGSAPQVADFEPWTDSTAGAQRSQAAFLCPHHTAVGSGTPGPCPVCGMPMEPNRSARRADLLHDTAYHMDLNILSVPAAGGAADAGAPARSPAPLPTGKIGAGITPAPGQAVRLSLVPRRSDGSIVRSLQVVHTKRLHLIIASRDLSLFDHVHPEQQPDGSLTLDYAFPAAGDYLLYADCTPTGDRNQVFLNTVTVAGKPAPAIPLVETPAQAKVCGAYRVRLDISPNPAAPRDETAVTFTLFEGGRPVTDLEPYLGAGGHCVALSEDGRAYLHSHPVEMGGSRFGPSITFHTVFPRSGLYKIWGQFRRAGATIVADFVVRVP